MKELLEKAWADHAEDPEGVRERLFRAIREIKGPQDLVSWSKIWTHVVGFELGEPQEALSVLSGLIPDDYGPDYSSCICDAFMLARLAEHEVATWSLRLLISAPLEFGAWTVKAEALLAEHRVESGDWVGLHALDLVAQAARALPAGNLAERSVAVSLNNGVSSAVEAEDLDAEYLALLVGLAKASREFWQRVGTPLNDARGAYLIQLAANAANEPALGVQAAHEAIKTLAALEDVEVDLTFVQLALASSQKKLGESHQEALSQADRTAAGWKGGLQDRYEKERRRGFGER